MVDKLLRFLLSPQLLVFKAWKAMPIGSFRRRLDYDIFPRPHYAFCMYHAAREAQQLGVEKISVIEFGVAGGNGLVEVEAIATLLEREFRTRFEIYGFDSGQGLPPPQDYRDLPYIWKEGFFRMDVDALERRLKRSKLVFGDVKDTVPGFFAEHEPAPIGVLFLDLDYYSSTRDSLEIVSREAERMLPRTFCYFDDVISDEFGGIYCDRVGQLRAVAEYNERNSDRCFAQIAGFARTRRRPATWNDQIYVHHAFDHPHYNTYIHADKDRQLPLHDR